MNLKHGRPDTTFEFFSKDKMYYVMIGLSSETGYKIVYLTNFYISTMCQALFRELELQH